MNHIDGDQALQSSRHHIRENVLILATRLFVLLFLTNSLFGLSLYMFRVRFDYFGIYSLEVFTIVWIAHAILFVIQTSFIIFMILQWAKTFYYITDRELIIVKGIIWEKNEIHDLNNVRSIKLNQSWLGRRLNFGSLILDFSASGGYQKKVIIFGIKNPTNYERIFRTYIRK